MSDIVFTTSHLVFRTSRRLAKTCVSKFRNSDFLKAMWFDCAEKCAYCLTEVQNKFPQHQISFTKSLAVWKNIYLCTDKNETPRHKPRLCVTQKINKKMKKFLFTLVAAVITLTASAQVYVGGEVNFWRNWNDNHTTFGLVPEIGYNLSDNWAIGTKIGYAYNYQDGTKVNGVEVAPYARYTFAKFDAVSLFVDGGFGFMTYKVSPKHGKSSDSQNGWEIGLTPGVKVDLTSKLSFVAHVGFFGYRDADDSNCAWGEDGFGLDLDGNNLNFGLYYNF